MRWRLLSDVPDEDVRVLLSVARRRRFQRGEVVFHRDDPGDSLHLIVSGRFAVRVMTPLGDMVWIAVRGPGDNFGEMALVEEEGRRSATVSALEEAETFAVRKPEFDGLRERYPGIDRLLIAIRLTLGKWTTRLIEEFANRFPGPGEVTAYRPDFAVHGKFGQPCPVCNTIVQRIRYAENETNYCPVCQTGGKILADRSLSRLLKDDWPRTIDELG